MPVVADALMSVRDEWIVVGDAAVAAMSVTTPSPLFAPAATAPSTKRSEPLMVTVVRVLLKSAN